MALFSGSPPYRFTHRDDLHSVPSFAHQFELRVHGSFAKDRRQGFGELYYGIPKLGLMRVANDLRTQTFIKLPETVGQFNFHSTKLGQVNGQPRLFLSANYNSLVAVLHLDGTVDFVLPRPEFEQYQTASIEYAPTDSIVVDDNLFIVDGYGSNFVSKVNLPQRQWVSIFGGKTEQPVDGKFTTAHGITRHPVNNQLLISDRPNSRIERYAVDGRYLASHYLPSGAWPCGLDCIQWHGKWIGVVGCLHDPNKNRPAPIYILDMESFSVLSTIRPKEELGVERAVHIHNAVWHILDDHLFLVCQSWKPGRYFVLEHVVG